jgi:hypothetical protein
MHTSFTLLNTSARMIIHGWKKFTQLGQWESFYSLRGQSTSCLVDPKTSFPSRCNRKFIKENFDV